MAEAFRPKDLSEAVAIAAGRNVTLAAGCTDLFAATRARAIAAPVLDLTALDGLKGIGAGADGCRIGALTTWTDIARAHLPPAFDALRAAAREVGAVQIQNAGTIGGNLCNASPAADGVPCLLALDASVELASVAGTRVMRLSDFLTGPRRTDLRRGEILTGVLVPKAALGGRSAFGKLGARRYLVISIAMAAVRIESDGDRITAAAIAVGACGPVAVRLRDQEEALLGVPPAEAAARIEPRLVAGALSPIDDIRADADYRRVAATEIVRRAVARAVAP
ncbi:MAG: FAD binding domain-containing protein [Pseudomonadota bacterium]